MNTYDIIQVVATAAFLAIVIARSIYMRVRDGVNPFALGSSNTGLTRVLEIAVPVVLVLWVAAVFITAVSGADALPSPLDDVILSSAAAQAIGAGLLFASIALFVASIASFGVSWRIGIDERSPGTLVTRGVFRYSRNPIFVSMGAFFLGIFLIQGTLFFLIALVIQWAWTHYQVLQEEKFLGNQYGDDYARYRAATPRYIGLPRRVSTGQPDRTVLGV